MEPKKENIRVRLNANIRKKLKKRLMIYCVENDVHQYDIVELALEDILDKLGAIPEDDIRE
ncbi:hypothetical protein [Bacillus xiapuensis]|uniref:Uncharacterized protein n=1 Tax=Bacillus xiapuensis TaxID=2014075 RepID=A0ABU6N5T0_9BACI|nr:hypothetical protein [Bacillus xiapuensis]